MGARPRNREGGEANQWDGRAGHDEISMLYPSARMVGFEAGA
jgi:hypothetical protein